MKLTTNIPMIRFGADKPEEQKGGRKKPPPEAQDLFPSETTGARTRREKRDRKALNSDSDNEE